MEFKIPMGLAMESQWYLNHVRGLQQQGQIPSKDQMVSTIIISPQHNQNIPHAKKDFTVVIAVDNLSAGQFTNPDTTYYSAPQQLDRKGFIKGHTHVTIQVLALCQAGI